MDPYSVLEYLKKKVAEREKDLENVVLSGSVVDISQYKGVIGELRGLSFVRYEIRSLLEKMEKAENV